MEGTRRFRIHGVGSRIILAIFGAVLGLFAAAIPGAILGSTIGRIPAVQIPVVVCAVLFALVGGVLMQRMRPPVVVGADGVRIGHRFIPHADIREVMKTTIKAQRGTLVSTRVALRLRGGEVKVLGSFMHDQASADQRAEGLAQAIEEARIAAPSTTEALGELLDPPEDDVAKLRAFVTDLAHKIGNYRDVTLSREEIMRVANDPATSPRRRVAAAMIYSHLAGTEGAAQLRLAAGSVVNEPVRLALEQVADGVVEDETIERVLRSSAEQA